MRVLLSGFLLSAVALAASSSSNEASIDVVTVRPYKDAFGYVEFAIKIRITAGRAPFYLITTEEQPGIPAHLGFQRELYDRHWISVGRYSDTGGSRISEVPAGTTLEFEESVMGYSWRGDPEQGVPVSGKVRVIVPYYLNRNDALAFMSTLDLPKSNHLIREFRVVWPSEVTCSLGRYPDANGKCSVAIVRQ
jgi:hypothetical protein